MRRPTAAQTRRWAAATTAALAVAAIAVAALAPAHHSRPAPPAPAAGHSVHGVGTVPHAGSEAADPHALPPLLPLTPRTVATLVAAAAVAALAAGGGIGGGGVLVPLYLLLLRASPRDAVALSNLTILGGALASFVRNAPRRHPTHDRPLVDWDIMLMMEPATVVGAVAGSYINRAAPPWATTSALAALLVAITAQLTARARRLLAAERAGDEALLGADGDGEAPPPPPPPAAAALADPHADPRLVPLPKLAALVALFGVVVASDEAKARVPRGSAAYWAAASAVAPAALAVSWVARRRLLKAAAAAPAPATPAAADDDDAPLHWTPTTTILFPAASTLAGVVAGAFGVGGGIVKGPLLLELGVSPPVAAATASAMILFTSASASVVYVSFGVPLDYGAALAAVGAAATAAGLTLVARVAAGRRSAVVVAMAGLLAASAVATGYYAALLVWGGGGVN